MSIEGINRHLTVDGFSTDDPTIIGRGLELEIIGVAGFNTRRRRGKGRKHKFKRFGILGEITKNLPLLHDDILKQRGKKKVGSGIMSVLRGSFITYIYTCRCSIPKVGGTVASWVVHSSPD